MHAKSVEAVENAPYITGVIFPSWSFTVRVPAAPQLIENSRSPVPIASAMQTRSLF